MKDENKIRKPCNAGVSMDLSFGAQKRTDLPHGQLPMENESTFVAPEGVYTVTEEHKPTVLPVHTINSVPQPYPTRVSSVLVRFPASKQGGAPGLAQLLGGGNREARKDKGSKEREDGISLSSSDTPDEGDIPQDNNNIPPSPTTTREPHGIFSHHPVAGKKKTAVRPKHNIRTSSSTFISRVQHAEGFPRVLQSKQGDTTFLFYNVAKTFLWIEAGSKSKVRV